MTEYDPRGDDEFDEYLRKARLFRAAETDARRMEAAAAWTMPPVPTSAYEQLAEAPPEVEWIFRDLWVGNAQINAQKKSGKTTFAMNAAASLLTRDPFLGRFDVDVESDCRVGYLNMELTKAQFNRWTSEMALPDEALKRLYPYHGREHGNLDFTNSAAAEWVVRWLRAAGITVVIMDPLGSFYEQPSGGDPNAAYLRWWRHLESVVREAELRGVLIVHHSGYSEDGGNRARGASAMMDKPDVNLTYRYNVGEGTHTDAPADTKRYLSAFGRDVDVKEFELEYNARARRLNVTGGGGRLDAEMVQQATRAWDIVRTAEERGEKPNKGELFEKLGWTNTGAGSGKCQRWYQYAIAQQWITAAGGGKGKPISHSPGSQSPHDGWRRKLESWPSGEGSEA